jgi:hypothetical protein
MELMTVSTFRADLTAPLCLILSRLNHLAASLTCHLHVADSAATAQSI